MEAREFTARVDGKGSDEGAASLFGDVTVFLTKDQAKALVEALTTALERRR